MPMQTERGDGGIAPTYSPHRRRWVVSNTFQPLHPQGRTVIIIIIIIIIMFINCNWVVTRWQWLFYMYTKYETGY